MRSNRIIRQAFKTLTDGEKELFSLLTGKATEKQDVITFLNHYDIDNEAAASSFLINELLDRFGPDEQDSPIIPRIRGLKEYFHFHNAAVMARIPSGETIVDHNLYLKIMHPDEVRPFTSVDRLMSRNDYDSIFGKGLAVRLLKDAVSTGIQTKEFIIPEERHLVEIINLELFLALADNSDTGSLLTSLYDMERYCKDEKPGAYVAGLLAVRGVRRRLGRVKRWLLRSRH